MENQNQNYAQYERAGVEEENNKTSVTGDPSETIDNAELTPSNEEAGIADVDRLLKEINNENGQPDPDDDDEDDDLDGTGLDDDDLDGDGLEDDDDFPVEPEEDEPDLEEDGIDEKEAENEEEYLNATQHS